MTQAELSRRAGVSAKHINQIAKGKAALSPDVAILFERVLGVPARAWNAAEAARKTTEAQDRLVAEVDLQRRVIDYAKLKGWRVVHFRPARQGNRWVTAVTGDPGAPDLILARDGRVLLVELKSATGGFRPGQREWLAAAGDNGRLWRPADWPVIMEELG